MKEISEKWKQISKNDSLLCNIDFNSEFSDFKIKFNANSKVLLPIKTYINDVLNQGVVKLNNINFTDLSVNEIGFNISLKVKNPFPNKITLEEAELKLSDYNKTSKKLGSWQLRNKVEIKGNSTKIVSGTLKINNQKLIKNIFKRIPKINMEFQSETALSLLISGYPFNIELENKILFNPISKKITILK